MVNANEMAILKGGPRNGDMLHVGASGPPTLFISRYRDKSYPLQIPVGHGCTYRKTGSIGSHGEDIYEYDPHSGG